MKIHVAHVKKKRKRKEDLTILMDSMSQQHSAAAKKVTLD